VARQERLARHPWIAALHDRAYETVPAPLAVGELALQVARAERAGRVGPWRGMPRAIGSRVPRQSDTLFVLGSGESINDHPAEHWRVVGAHDALGLNFWLLHRFVPSAYLFEWVGREPSAAQQARLAVRQELLRLRAPEIDGRPLLFRLPAWRSVGARAVSAEDVVDQLGCAGQNLVVTSDLNLPELDAHGVRRTLALLRRLGALTPRPSWRYLASARGSVLWAVLYGLRMGYRHIVLCGVDLAGTNYFFDDPAAPDVVAGAPIPVNTQSGPVHKTADPTVPGATMPELLAAVRDELLGPAGVDLRIAHRSSTLAREFDLYDWTAAAGRADAPEEKRVNPRDDL
jgi:hypothetical protein